jgi:hypothetical protein
MGRREFVKFLALIGAGTSALPDQIAAFEAYYEANTPMVQEPLVAVDEVMLTGLASRSLRVFMELFADSGQSRKFGINTFGGIMRWTAQGNQTIVLRRRHLTWDIKAIDPAPVKFEHALLAHISYIDQTHVRRVLQISDWRGALA